MQHVAPAARGLLLGTVAVWLLVELRQRRTHRPDAVKADQGSRLVLQVANLAGFAVAIGIMHVAPLATIHPAGAAAWTGLGVLWSGIALRVWSIRTLGRYFTYTVQIGKDQPVITTGPYRIIRHPSYTGLLLVVIGLGLLIGNWLSLVGLTAVVMCALAYRIKVEERALLKNLGEHYRSYAATHRRLIPVIW